MTKKKKTTLPENFSELTEKGDIKALKKVFDECDVNARGGYGKSTALSFFGVPDELTKWLIENGADIEAKNIYGDTALHEQLRYWKGNPKLLIELGADIEAKNNDGETPLHSAAGSYKSENVKMLLKHGANHLAKSKNVFYKDASPLEYALIRCNPINISEMAKIAKILLGKNTPVTKKMKEAVEKIGLDFEFHRNNFNKDYLYETDKGLKTLYKLFDVLPVPKRKIHDGKSKITVKEKTWQKQYEELWELLVPSEGACETLQGEVIRTVGRVHGELYRNGGGNWDKDYRKMLNAFLKYITMCNSLNEKETEEAKKIAENIKGDGSEEDKDLYRLKELAVKWVLLNPNPIKLGKVDYKR